MFFDFLRPSTARRHRAAMLYTHQYLERLFNDAALQQELERRIEAIVDEKIKMKLDGKPEHLLPVTDNQ